MPPIQYRDCREDAVYWAKDGTDDHSQTTVTSTYEIVKIRWMERQRTGTDSKGNSITTDIQIACKERLTLDSIIYRGTLDDIPGTSNVPESSLYQIINESTVKDVRNRIQRYEYGLIRFHDRLPLSS